MEMGAAHTGAGVCLRNQRKIAMHLYKEKDILRVAKRVNNRRRQYLLVNPLQAKHVPVSPSAALRMMSALGENVAAAYGETRLVIGFAETATAVGAMVARSVSEDCVYLTTTRESVPGVHSWVFFSEEHSHASEQKLAADRLEMYFRETDTIVFVDDEFSTGKTLINMIRRLKSEFPIVSEKKIVAASIINRLTRENAERWAAEGIQSVCLLQLPFSEYHSQTAEMRVSAAERFFLQAAGCDADVSLMVRALPDPRTGVAIGDYCAACADAAEELQNLAALSGGSVLVLGTEECMLPALLIGAYLEQTGAVESVFCHATTRSPIGVSEKQAYPIRSGWKIRSFYDPERETYLYNLRKYDAAVVVSDSGSSYDGALEDLCALLGTQGCRRIICMVGEKHA